MSYNARRIISAHLEPTMKRLPTACICSLFVVATLLADDKEQLPPIEHLNGITPKAEVFEAVKGKEPLVLKTADEAAKHFGDEALAALKKKVDFDKQLVFVFAWKGSGQDKLEYRILESSPEQVVFELRPGRTKDLRPHTQVYALRSNVKWK
jgi:hypothetical protein